MSGTKGHWEHTNTMQRSEYQEKEMNIRRDKAIKLYQSGLTLREVSKVVKMSHEWVRQALKSRDLSPRNRGINPVRNSV